MDMRKTAAIAAVFGIFSGPMSAANADEDVGIYGSTTVASSILTPFEESIEQKAGVLININAIGSSRGILALVEGQADMGMISAPLANVVREINKKQPGSIDGRALVAHPIGKTTVAFVVHPSNPVKRLTFKQVSDILAGRVKFWNDVGGNSVKIEVVSEYKGGGIRTLVEKKIGEWGDVLTDSSEVQTGTQVVFAVSSLPSALGISTVGQVTSAVYPVITDETISQPLFLVTKGQPDERLQRIIDVVRSMGTGESKNSS